MKQIDRFIDVNGYKTRYWDTQGDKPVVLLLHGYGLSCEVWSKNVDYFARSFRVIACDIWGFGLTQVPKSKVDMELYPEFIYWFLQALKIQSVHVVGHSMGGLLSLKVALNHPNCVQSLILVGSAGFDKSIPIHFKIFSLPLLGEIMAKPNRIGLRHALKKNVYHDNEFLNEYSDVLFEYSKKEGMENHLLGMARGALGLFGMKNSILKKVHDAVPHITCPVLLLWGKQDPIIHYKSALKAHELLVQSKIEIFDKCGHLPQIEYPDQFNQKVEKFLYGISGTSD